MLCRVGRGIGRSGPSHLATDARRPNGSDRSPDQRPKALRNSRGRGPQHRRICCVPLGDGCGKHRNKLFPCFTLAVGFIARQLYDNANFAVREVAKPTLAEIGQERIPDKELRVSPAFFDPPRTDFDVPASVQARFPEARKVQLEITVTPDRPAEKVEFCVSAPHEIVYLGTPEFGNSEAEIKLMDVQPTRLPSGRTECWTVQHMKRDGPRIIRYGGLLSGEDKNELRSQTPTLDVQPQKGYTIRYSPYAPTLPGRASAKPISDDQSVHDEALSRPRTKDGSTWPSMGAQPNKIVDTGGAERMGALVGAVTDATGAAVSNANVEVADPATGNITTGTTDDNGQYHFDIIPVGPYDLSFSAPGFVTTKIESVDILGATTATVNACLEFGSMSTTVDVAEGAAMVETTSTDLQPNLDSRQILELPPLWNRTGQLARLNVALAATVAASDSTGQGTALIVDRRRDTNFTIDGVDNNNLMVEGAAGANAHGGNHRIRSVAIQF